jgi:hypothetical protein
MRSVKDPKALEGCLVLLAVWILMLACHALAN